MSATELLHRYLDQCPLVGIIRGVTPDQAEAIGDAIYESGIRIIEVPLNSPAPLQSIELLAKKFGDDVLVGAGTVLDPSDVGQVWDAGGRIIVSPDTNIDVIAATARTASQPSRQQMTTRPPPPEPLASTLAPEVWGGLRRSAKQAVIGRNVRRAIDAAGGVPRGELVTLVGGCASDRFITRERANGNVSNQDRSGARTPAWHARRGNVCRA